MGVNDEIPYLSSALYYFHTRFCTTMDMRGGVAMETEPKVTNQLAFLSVDLPVENKLRALDLYEPEIKEEIVTEYRNISFWYVYVSIVPYLFFSVLYYVLPSSPRDLWILFTGGMLSFAVIAYLWKIKDSLP